MHRHGAISSAGGHPVSPKTGEYIAIQTDRKVERINLTESPISLSLECFTQANPMDTSVMKSLYKSIYQMTFAYQLIDMLGSYCSK